MRLQHADPAAPPLLAMHEGAPPPEDLAEVASVLRSGWLTMGPRTMELEAAAAAHLGVSHAVAAAADSAVLHLALLAAGVQPGDEVIVPAIGGAVAAHAARRSGATVVAVGVTGPLDPLLDPDDVRDAVGPHTRAVVAVHLAGLPAAASALREACDAAGAALLEHVTGDAAGTLEGRSLGTFGAAGCFALLPGGASGGDAAGLLATDDPAIAAAVRSRRSHAMTSGTWARHTGRTDTYDVEDLGFNYRVDEPRAVLACARLLRSVADGARRRALAGAYRDALAAVGGVVVPTVGGRDAGAAWDAFPVVLADPRRRAEVRHALATAGIGTLTPARVPGASQRDAAAIAEGLLLLPLHTGLQTEDVARVARALEAALSR
jgi:dTDP-4-amino-4,6-dideoxygalactose transaminase